MRTFYAFITALLCLPALFTSAQECSGTSTSAGEGTFTEGYNYTFTTNGDVVSATFQLIEPRDGLVAYAQTYNPNFEEVPMTAVMGEDQTFTADFPGQTAGATFLMACKFAFAGGLSTTTIISYTVGEGCTEEGGGNVSLPITFEEDIDYELVDFGGNASEIVADPTDASNTVVQSIKTVAAQTWAGTTVADISGFDEPLPFGPGATTMTVRVWSPLANIPVRLKVEQVGVPTISVETEATVTTAEEWVTLTFDFANQAAGTAVINFANTYNKASIFFNFGTTGADSGEQTYYWDDVEFGGEGVTPPPVDPIDLPITFEEDINYGLVDFGGNASEIVADPTDASNTVVQSIKTVAAQTWAGTTVAEGIGFTEALPFTADETTMTVRVWSPLANIPVRLKVEALNDPTISVETEATVTTAEEWVTLTFDFANQAPGTAALNLNSSYEKASIFFNFGTTGADSGEQTYYWDDLTFGAPDLPEPISVYDIISGSAQHTTLTTAIDAAGLDGTLSGAGTLTVFAPTDAAFELLGDGVVDALLADPDGALTQLLLRHVLGNIVMSGDITDGSSATSLQGSELEFSIVSDNVFVNDAQVTVPDLEADNGVVHVINGVLTVPDNIEDMIANSIEVNLYPNPANQSVRIEHGFESSERVLVQLYNLNSQLVMQESMNGKHSQIFDVSALPVGMYLITISTNEQIAFDKLLIAR